MTSALTLVPPAIALFVLAIVVDQLSRRVGHAIAVGGSLATCLWILTVPAGTHLETVLFGFDAVLFNVDVYSRLLGGIFGFIAAAGVAYAFTADADRRQTAAALAYIGTGMGAAFAGDWLTLIVFWELMALCATVLLWYRTSDRATGIRYAIYHEIGGLALIGGVLLHYTQVGTFLFSGGITAGLPATLVALGIGLNAGFLGLHAWLVDSYPQTHVASSVVLAAITTKVGAYTIVRAFPNGHVALAYIGGAMVLFGVTFAILQTDMRRLLSYHIISQVGYMVAGFGAGVALAKAGAMAHLVNNILYKSLLFMVAGVLIQRTGKENLKKLGGLARVMPLTAGVFLVAAFSITGIPGFNGFISKAMVIDGVQKAKLEILWYVLIIGGVGTVISFAKFGYYAFLHGPPQTEADYDDLSPLELGTLGSVATLCLLVGVAPSLLFGLLPSEGVSAAKPFASKQFVKTGAVTLTGIVVFVVIRRRLSHVTPVSDLDAVYNPVGRRLQALCVNSAVSIDAHVEHAGRRVRAGLRMAFVGGYNLREQSIRALLGHSSSIGAGILAIVLILVLLLAVLFV